MTNNRILTVESWFLCADIKLENQGHRNVCSWSHHSFRVDAELTLGASSALTIQITEASATRLNAKATGIPHSGGWIFVFHIPDATPSIDEFDRSTVRVFITQDAELRTLFANVPFGLSYMPVMRHFIDKKPPGSVLEWGPGRSTLMLAESLPSTEIFAIEHAPQWHERMVTLARKYPSVTPIHEPLIVQPAKSGKYITAPLYLDRKFDLIFIDGRMRTDCIAIARQVLNENGVVLVHDIIHRKGYHQAFRFFRSVVIVNDTAVLRI